ncbi:MAG TPA: metallophosphoesterase [Acetobacteraceae bacterium]|nr:metallophosphoesterase [Acetobacteraceae bacterium]
MVLQWPAADKLYAEFREQAAMTVFFTADTHFHHAGAIGFYRRPFASAADMDAAMLARWNEAVGPGDEVWHLGDFALRLAAEPAGALLRQLHGRKHLVTGNNDPPEIAALPGWASVQAYAEILLDGTRLVLCHYPFRTWNGLARGALNLHGHSHGRLKPVPRQIDVGVDVWGFRPVTLAQLRAGPG